MPSPSTSSSPSTSTNQQLSDFNHQVMKGMAAGVLAAAISKSAVAPMDRVKLVLQVHSIAPSILNGHFQLQSVPFHSQIAIQCQQPYQGILDCFRRLCAEQGVRSLWRGNSAAVIRCLPNQALNLAFRDRFRIAFLDGIERKRQPIRFILGSQLALNPSITNKMENFYLEKNVLKMQKIL